MKTTLALAVLGTAVTLALAPVAQAAPAWVEDESANICNSLNLASTYDRSWVTTQISLLQLSHDIGRAEAVAGIRAAAIEYCPEYLSVVPAK
ncbi:hypothetical protein [Mycolicibacterium phage Kashi_SSH1]|nr:hypothetical protein [Mycolicibacterium phage Kashi_SSH1]